MEKGGENCGSQVKGEESTFPPARLEHRSEGQKDQHVDEDVKERVMGKCCGQGSPDAAARQVCPTGHELVLHEVSRGEVPGDEDNDVDGDDQLHRTHTTDHAARTA